MTRLLLLQQAMAGYQETAEDLPFGIPDPTAWHTTMQVRRPIPRMTHALGKVRFHCSCKRRASDRPRCDSRCPAWDRCGPRNWPSSPSYWCPGVIALILATGYGRWRHACGGRRLLHATLSVCGVADTYAQRLFRRTNITPSPFFRTSNLFAHLVWYSGRCSERDPPTSQEKTPSFGQDSGPPSPPRRRIRSSSFSTTQVHMCF